jgi:hypothetical protein
VCLRLTRTSNFQRRMMYSVNLKKAEQSKLPVEIRFACLRQAQAPRPPALRGESFDPEITADGRVTGCCSLVIKSIKRSLRLVGVVAPTPRRASSIFDVRCWAFDVRRSIWSMFRPDGISYEVSYDVSSVSSPKAKALIVPTNYNPER